MIAVASLFWLISLFILIIKKNKAYVTQIAVQDIRTETYENPVPNTTCYVIGTSTKDNKPIKMPIFDNASVTIEKGQTYDFFVNDKTIVCKIEEFSKLDNAIDKEIKSKNIIKIILIVTAILTSLIMLKTLLF